MNGVDWVANDDQVFTFVGPNAGRMIWVYILIILFILLLIILLLALISTYWNSVKLSVDRDVRTANRAHTFESRPVHHKDEFPNPRNMMNQVNK